MDVKSHFADKRLPDWLLRSRIPILVAVHLFAFSVAHFAAYLIRFDGSIPDSWMASFWYSLPWVCAIQLLCFWLFDSFHGWWRYVTFRDLIEIAKPLILSCFLVIVAVFLDLPKMHVPRSVPILQLMVAGLLLAGLRSSWRLIREVMVSFRPDKASTHAFIISNNHETLVLANQINCQRGSQTKIVGILSQARHKKGSKRAGIPIVGSPHDAPRLAEKFQATQVWLTAGSIPGSELAELKKQYDAAGLYTRVIPAATDRNLGGSFIPLREIQIEDLLQRPAVKLDDEQISSEISGHCVMVTGAGGSIGSELCRQLLRFKPATLILVEHRENSVFLVQNELQQILRDSGNTVTKLIPAVGDVLDVDRMTWLFEAYQPQYLYHAAAHKHVGLMEVNAGEGIKNNIQGTRQLADLANEFSVVKFVLVSTDKAVNPTSVMGCTKQIAERYVLSLGSNSRTKFIVVRFGNVLGSNGSVVPIFKDQISRGGPITITDPRMTRFFMTIPEASQLILQAGSMGNGGEIFVLDMGEQVKIVDLAEKMIELAGLPQNAIEIKFVGARPGEKLYEELYFDEEEAIKTSHHKIFAARHRMLNYEDVVQCIEQLVGLQTAPNDVVRRKLKYFIPEYLLDEATGGNSTSIAETPSVVDADTTDESQFVKAK